MSDTLTWIVDTGATRCVLFEDALAGAVSHHHRWRAMEGLSAPTLFGDERGRVARVPRVSIRARDGDVVGDDVETVMIGGPLARNLAIVVGEPVHGLIGYSFLGRFRIGIDYVNRALWLDPLPDGWEGRPYRDSQIGIQLERRGGAITVAGVVRASPAADAGVQVGDRIVTLGGTPSRQLDVPAAIRRLEGRPGTSITLTIQRGNELLTHKLLRRRLL
jgi:membrane-associated protease RseP (regulator of RpoE activity)